MLLLHVLSIKASIQVVTYLRKPPLAQKPLTALSPTFCTKPPFSHSPNLGQELKQSKRHYNYQHRFHFWSTNVNLACNPTQLKSNGICKALHEWRSNSAEKGSFEISHWSGLTNLAKMPKCRLLNKIWPQMENITRKFVSSHWSREPQKKELGWNVKRFFGSCTKDHLYMNNLICQFCQEVMSETYCHPILFLRPLTYCFFCTFSSVLNLDLILMF